ncbi:hypothetical protein K435DRAFT_484551 [Dendrothele bispora CBS 962.96]|uniref:Uncharacterized protein n=1 Tax=Dendrothele bispora (strain CBS 962.96) TaxID=1314807 RepID=A0A4S8MV79_DENBC|nr:hypothetical protein K435DRAFT_484551 [Dendrothele bispora CBS 962.96]
MSPSRCGCAVYEMSRAYDLFQQRFLRRMRKMWWVILVVSANDLPYYPFRSEVLYTIIIMVLIPIERTQQFALYIIEVS